MSYTVIVVPYPSRYPIQFQSPEPSAEVSAWDDLCVYGNGLLEALNGLKYTASPVLVGGL